ncbi:sugar nucleotide-binding protein [Pectobacterium sp. B1J-3]|uniref:sugar nucleotide-binding protein n=1 Tax=Pectobacterium sp. B1J-3 TaxID=3385371 RepID=UPI0039067FB3
MVNGKASFCQKKIRCNSGYRRDLALVITSLLEKEAESGIYHYSGDKGGIWYEFSEEIFSVAEQKTIMAKIPTLKPIATEQYPTPAHRPAFSTLACGKMKRLGIRLSS